MQQSLAFINMQTFSLSHQQKQTERPLEPAPIDKVNKASQ